ncbi:uncharacterized protein EV422DRAFT_484449, partial [Fimicolochytrium jonesii]|uniref:uncharacterized protein n=1 Tax=Fimicolochytrium jonesii TaxID=1396493 RepID=UPI0022FEB57E
LIQENLHANPWAVLVATMLLNLTRGDAVRPVLWVLLGWKGYVCRPPCTLDALTNLFRPLGLQNIRAVRLVRLSRAFVKWNFGKNTSTDTHNGSTRLPPLPGVGAYARESYELFCEDAERWRSEVGDKELKRYVGWRRGV